MTSPTASTPLRTRLRGPLESALPLLAGVVAWEIGARLWGVSFLPPFSTVVDRLVELTLAGRIGPSLVASMTNLLIGSVISVVGGVGIGLLMGASRKIELALDVYVYGFLTAPTLVFAPILFSIFGLGSGSIIALIVISAMWVIIINTVAGVHAVEAEQIEMARSFNASRRDMVLKVMLPSALPLAFAGLRLGAGRAVKGWINGEMFIAVVGLGSILMKAGRMFDAETVLAIVLLVMVIAYLVVGLVQLVDQRVNRWLPSTERAQRTN